MAQFQPALDYVLDWEDPKREYAAVPDVGGQAIAGVNSAAWPVDYPVIAAASGADRIRLVSNFYRYKFWNPIQVGGIQDQDTANRVMDQSVNGGGKTGPRLLQEAANSIGANLIEDGALGPDTLEAVNGIDPDRLLATYRLARTNHYKSIAAAIPADAQYLPEWLKRANG